jgi:hypothetical protein
MWQRAISAVKLRKFSPFELFFGENFAQVLVLNFKKEGFFCFVLPLRILQNLGFRFAMLPFNFETVLMLIFCSLKILGDEIYFLKAMYIQ